MSQRARSIQCIEGRILRVLAKAKTGNEPTNMALCAMTLDFEVRSLEEQHNFDYALYNLIRQGVVIQTQDKKGFRVLTLAA